MMAGIDPVHKVWSDAMEFPLMAGLMVICTEAEVTSGQAPELTVLLNQVVWDNGLGVYDKELAPEMVENPEVPSVTDDSHVYE
jgi:hypothetical protein